MKKKKKTKQTKQNKTNQTTKNKTKQNKNKQNKTKMLFFKNLFLVSGGLHQSPCKPVFWTSTQPLGRVVDTFFISLL